MACTIEDTYERPRIFNQRVQWDNAEIVKQLARIADALSLPTPAAPTPEPSAELRLLRELERAVREAVAEYEGWYSPEVKDALAELDAAEEGR